MAEIAEFFYGHKVMSVDTLMVTVGTYVGIHGEEWDVLLDSEIRRARSIVPLLASESPIKPKRPLRLSVPQATLLLYDLQKRDRRGTVISQIFERVSREEAMLLWARVLGEYPPVRKRNFLRAIAKCSGYAAERLGQACKTHGIGAVVKSALDGSLPRSHEIVAGVPFSPAVYTRWVNWQPPYEHTLYEAISTTRAFVHKSPDGVWVFRRSGERWAPHPPLEGLPDCEEVVAEVEQRGDKLVLADLLHSSEHPQNWKRPCSERLKLARSLRDSDQLLSLLRNLERNTTLRLSDAGAPYFDSNGEGGCIAPSSLFEVPLLLTRVRVVDGMGELCLSAADGYDYEQVACVPCDPQILRVPRLRGHLTSRWVDIEALGVIIVCIAFGYDGESIDGCSPLRLDGSLGLSDTIQKGDLFALSDA